MKLTWSSTSWDDYLYWQKVDKKMVKRINVLIKSCMRTPFEAIGKPEALKGDLHGYWSRRITSEHQPENIGKVVNDDMVLRTAPESEILEDIPTYQYRGQDSRF